MATRAVLLAVSLGFAVAAAGAAAQVSGQVRELVLPIRELTLPRADLALPVETLAGATGGLQLHETAAELRVELAADILFDFDKSDIRPAAAGALRQVADLIRDKAHGRVRIEGHTDAKGSDTYNQRLSERRAAAVKAWLVGKEGLKTTVFDVQGLGARRPVAPNARPDGSDDPDGRQKNRRVELVINKG